MCMNSVVIFLRYYINFLGIETDSEATVDDDERKSQPVANHPRISMYF